MIESKIIEKNSVVDMFDPGNLVYFDDADGKNRKVVLTSGAGSSEHLFSGIVVFAEGAHQNEPGYFSNGWIKIHAKPFKGKIELES